MNDRSTNSDAWREKSLEELAHEQGLERQDAVEQLIGRGKELWPSDDDLDAFLCDIEERRHQSTIP